MGIVRTLSTAAGIPEPMEPTVLWGSCAFHDLVKQWHEQRVEISSSISEIIACPGYLRIIAMGRRALPLIIEQLKSEGDDPDHWCAALEAITGEDPVPEDAHGDTVRIAQAWIEWSKTSWNSRALDEGRTIESRALGLLSTTAFAWAAESHYTLVVAQPRAALPEVYWPLGVRREVTIAAFVEAFQSLGYETCTEGNLENGVIKVALFADEAGKPTHAARQLPDGCWTSKLGELEDIEHTNR